jgi:hypothetical protein
MRMLLVTKVAPLLHAAASASSRSAQDLTVPVKVTSPLSVSTLALPASISALRTSARQALRWCRKHQRVEA